MNAILSEALAAGVERLSAWADLLDQINVFPVADGDTGRNLVVSLSPLRNYRAWEDDRGDLERSLLVSARGNAGNIAARFFSGFLAHASGKTKRALATAAREGRSLAWQAVAEPKQGTMLTLFDALEKSLQNLPSELDEPGKEFIINRLRDAVRSTPRLLPRLKEAGVVDAGALGMYLFFESFFTVLAAGDGERVFLPLKEIFPEGLELNPVFCASSAGAAGYCVDMTLRAANVPPEMMARLTAEGESVVAHDDGAYVKIHLHTSDTESIRKKLSGVAEVLSWKEENLALQSEDFCATIPRSLTPIHILTDAAGSLTRRQARELGFSLLDSYVTLGHRSLPETSLDPAQVYEAMRRGEKAATAQASLFERHQVYAQALERYRRVLYLCVGSAYTGNVEAARDWKARHDRENRLEVLDTGAASGRLGLLALAVAQYAEIAVDGDVVISYARRLQERCEEYLFPDKLKHLAQSGRLSRNRAVLGDLLHVKPVVCPTPEGAKKVASVHTRKEQLAFALERLSGILATLPEGGSLWVMLEYSDNQDWVSHEVREAVVRQVPGAEVLIQPLSLTTGVHTGPGTWGMAFLPIPGTIDLSDLLREEGRLKTAGEGRGRKG